MTPQMHQEFQGWIEGELRADQAETGESPMLTAIVVKHCSRLQDTEIHRLESDAGAWPDTQMAVWALDNCVWQHARRLVGVQRYVLQSLWDGEPRNLYRFVRMGAPPLKSMDAELCSRIVGDFEEGILPVKIVCAYRVSFALATTLHQQWLAAKRAHTPKPAPKRASTKISQRLRPTRGVSFT